MMKKLKPVLWIITIARDFVALTFIFMSCFFIIGCANEVVLSYLYNSPMTIILKGTYATDRPLDWAEINNNQLFVDADDNLTLRHEAQHGCSPSMETDCVPAYDKLPIYLDVGDVRVSKSTSSINRINSSSFTERFWDLASSRRQVYCSQYYTSGGPNDTCRHNKGLALYKAFMDGSGAIYPSRDISNTNYTYTGVFVRRFMTGWATVMNADGTRLVKDTFDNNQDLTGRVITLQVSSNPPLPEGSEEEEDSNTRQWFPLHYSLGLGHTLKKEDEYFRTILEIRFNIKENLMVHSYSNLSSSTTTVVAFSDWRHNHQNDTSRNISDNARLGGNVLSRARFFSPHRVSIIEINNTSIPVTPIRHYFALYREGETDKQDQLPYAATPARAGNDNVLNHIMPGRYVLECREDSVRDGYPELTVSSVAPMLIEVPQEPERLGVSYPCGGGSSN